MIKSMFLFIGSCFLFIFVLVFLAMRISFLSRAEKVDGHVTSVSSYNDRCSSGSRRRRTYYDCTKFSAVISFVTNRGEGHSFTVSAGSSRGHNQPDTYASYRPGEAVPVLYDPKDPSNACRNTFMDKWGTPFMLFVFQIITLIASMTEKKRRVTTWR